MVVEQQVQLVDVYPTLVDLLGLPVPRGCAATRCARCWRAPARADAPPECEAFAENTNVRTYERKAMRTGRFKFILSIPRRRRCASGGCSATTSCSTCGGPARAGQPGAAAPDVVRFLEQQLHEIRAASGTGGLQEEVPAQIDDELRAQLRALGYAGN